MFHELALEEIVGEQQEVGKEADHRQLARQALPDPSSRTREKSDARKIGSST